MKNTILTLSLALYGVAAYGQGHISSFTATSAQGSLEILQVTGAIAGPTAGGPAVADTRTIFFWTPDLAKTPPVSPGYTGGNWPFVFVSPGFTVAASLNPTMFDTVNVVGTGGNLSGTVLTVNGFPVYQRTSHTGQGQTAGIGANWPVIGTDGLGYTMIPEPATASLALLGLVSLVLARHGQRRASLPEGGN